MPISNLKLDDLKSIFNYVSEAITISDERYNIVLINDAAAKKLKLDYNTIYTKKLMDYIPDDQIHKVVESIENNLNDYYEIVLQRENGELFPALVSGKEMILEGVKYRISTILDVTELKEKEQELLAKSANQLKKLKTHIITNVNEKSKELNKVKNESVLELKTLQKEVLESEYQNKKLTKRIDILKQDIEKLEKEIKESKENSYDFIDLLELEILKAKAHKFHFSLVKVVIDDFEELKNTLKTNDKLKMILVAIKRQMKSSLKSGDIIYQEKNGVYYLILSNAMDINITSVVETLIIPKKMDHNILIEFSYGIAHFFEKDDPKGMIYRCDKNLEANLKIKKEEKLK